MNDPGENRERSPAARRRWLLWAASLPTVVGVIALAILGFGEYRSACQVRAEIARLRAAGEPVDNETQARWFQANSSQEGTAAWREILVAVEQVSSGEAVGSFPIIGTGKFPERFVPGEHWPDEPRIAEFLQEIQPLIGKIEQAGRYPTPVWQPIAFNGFFSRPESQASRSVMWLLQLEVQYALYRRDTERARRGLAAMRITAAALSWDCSVVTNLVGMALRDTHRDTIRQSLLHTDWEPAQLDQLLAQVEPYVDAAAQWQRIFAGERAMTLAWVQSSVDLDRMLSQGDEFGAAAMLLTPSCTKKYLDNIAAVQQIGTEGVLGIGTRARDWENKTFPPDRRQFHDLLTDLFEPAVAALGTVYERDELARRLTRTALALKRYRVSAGRWPARLSDLAEAGLNPVDWTALQAGPFGYKIEGEDAVVWAYDVHDPGSPSRIRSEPPGKKEVSSWHATRIGHARHGPPER